MAIELLLPRLFYMKHHCHESNISLGRTMFRPRTSYCQAHGPMVTNQTSPIKIRAMKSSDVLRFMDQRNGKRKAKSYEYRTTTLW